MGNSAVIGLGFGDEGKGLTTNLLVAISFNYRNPIVIRYSGGQQAGHTVKINEKSHVFSNFGSGTLLGAPTYWSKYCTFDPISVINELSYLRKLNVSPLIYVDNMAPITTPFDSYKNQKCDVNKSHGTCGTGVGMTYQREEDFYSLTFGDIFYSSVLKNKMNLIESYYNFDVNISLSKFYESIEKIKLFSDIFVGVNELPSQYNERIFEGSQGLLLDQNIGFFPHVTRSNTGSKNNNEILKENPNYNGFDVDLYLITRAYQTRHGNGPMSSTKYANTIMVDPMETNVTNEYQDEFKRTQLDVDLLLYGINKDPLIRNSKRKTLVITCLDHLTEGNIYAMMNGEFVHFNTKDEFVSSVSKFLNIENVLISESPYSEKIRIFSKVNELIYQ